MTADFRSLQILGLATMALGGALAIAEAQSLGDVARDAAARRTRTGAGKGYTDANLPQVQPAPAAARDAQAPATADDAKPSGTGTGAATKDDAPKDEAYWRGRVTALRDAKARAESFAEALQSRINALSNDFVNRDDPAQRNLIAADRQKAIDELARVQKEIQEHAQAMDDLQTEARRAGAPAGWLR
jgi:hypothetical protein